ncbi:pp-loop family [Trichoderma arundinaceum]|uniref:tRNA(Ile)-lysidine synthetase n=1 Tax=Trichoderma arundinaceum TaxID=490622 RepID=A0A395NAS8_TRIAR|nr:pp-loop family [Trichoderma arundinaceum]
MAYLFSSLLRVYKGIKIADNPAESAFGIVVDHGLREESSQEASRVTQELKRLGLKAVIKPLNWREHRWHGIEPTTLPNVESVARTMRYQALGSTCRYLQARSLFFAHHQDDQYETVLMRLLSGHGYRGLQGIREANEIPECYELHGVYKSGLLDDQMQKHPFLSFRPPTREMKRLRYILKDDRAAEPWDRIKSYLSLGDTSTRFPGHLIRDLDPTVPYLTPLHSEDGGVTVYRPLLEFDKARLIATCEANGVRWFEDRTNTDPTLTTRNAIRQLTRVHTLPRALQKPSILALARRSRRRAQLEEAEAHRLLVRENVIQDFDPNAGTLLINVSTLWREEPLQMRRPFALARDEARKRSRRLLATMAIRKLIAFVTPDLHLPPLTNLDNAVDRLFPDLFGMHDLVPVAQPKAFSIAGVLFEPVLEVDSVMWLLSRAPYSSRQPLPERKLPGYLNYRAGVLRLEAEGDPQPSRHSHWRSWKTAKLWDGRFWIRVSACVAAKFHVLPFLPSSAKPFRMALPPRERDNFERILKHYAPGKVRYSLPALYSVEGSGDGEDSEQVMTLLALPTLGIHVPGLERWVKYEARYKNIDITLLGSAKRKGSKVPFLGHPGRPTGRQGPLQARGNQRNGGGRTSPSKWKPSTSQ